MSAVRRYQKYPEAVRIQVAKTQNPYLFPEYNIPRTTALYWIQNSIASQVASISEETLAERKIKSLEIELQKEKAFRILVEKVRSLFSHNFKDHRVPTKIIRKNH
jgi:hypothetical protein